MQITIENVEYEITETEECYVSHWSRFILSVIPPKRNNMVVCDFGAGTGVIGITAALTGAKRVIAVEKDAAFGNLLRHNVTANGLDSKIDIVTTSKEAECSEHYDYIFCNPACYPSAVGNSSFYHAGEMGMDMIIEVFKFASKTLKKNGHLLILTPSVSPSSIAFDMLKELGLHARPAKHRFVRLREHLTLRIKNWVDSNKKQFPEMCYHEKDGKFYEKVNLHSVHFIDNINRDDVDIRFFKGFEYTIETLPENVISCLDAATAKMIPLEHELKSLVLKTGKGLYVLSLLGSAFANLRAVKTVLGVKQASMASEEELKSLGLRKGAVCPVLNRLWDMPQLISKEVFELDYVSTNAGKLNECIIFNPKELLKHHNLIVGEFSKEDTYIQEVDWIG